MAPVNVKPTHCCLFSLLSTLIDWCEPRCFSLPTVSAEFQITGLLPFSPRFLLHAPRSAVDLIRLGGGRLRFLVAKSDPDVSEKISASSCWRPLIHDSQTTRNTDVCANEQGIHNHTPSSCNTWHEIWMWKLASAQTGGIKVAITLCASTTARPASLSLTPTGFVWQTESVTHCDVKGKRSKESCLINERWRWARSHQPVCSLMWFKAQ